MIYAFVINSIINYKILLFEEFKITIKIINVNKNTTYYPHWHLL